MDDQELLSGIERLRDRFLAQRQELDDCRMRLQWHVVSSKEQEKRIDHLLEENRMLHEIVRQRDRDLKEDASVAFGREMATEALCRWTCAVRCVRLDVNSGVRQSVCGN